MRKKMLFGCFIACFVLLMMPNVNSIEIQTQKNNINSKSEGLNYTSFVKAIKNIPKEEYKEITKRIIQDNENDSMFRFSAIPQLKRMINQCTDGDFR